MPAVHRTGPDVIRVLVVDDSAAVRAGLATLLGTTADVAVVGSASDGAEGVVAARELSPDVVLMDLSMPIMDGFAATVALRAVFPPVRVLVLTTNIAGDAVHRARAAGAAGYLKKSVDPDELMHAIRAVAAGGTAWCAEASEALRHAG